MNARQKLHQIHLQEWTVRFADQKASGLTVRQWCEQNNLSFHTYNYWKHLLKEEVVEQALPDIVPLSLPVLSDSGSLLETTVPNVRSIRANRSIRSNNSNVQMQINSISIEIDSSVSEEFLYKLIRTHQGGVPCLKMPTTVILPVSISSVDTQISASGSIRWLPSSNADFICICLYLTPSSFSVAGLPPGSRGFSGKAMDSCSFTNV